VVAQGSLKLFRPLPPQPCQQCREAFGAFGALLTDLKLITCQCRPQGVPQLRWEASDRNGGSRGFLWRHAPGV
jgi:hypothetical protein